MTHLDSQTLAALVEGKLDGDELREATHHLENCDDCREILAESARAQRDVHGKPLSAARIWPLALSVAAVLAIGFFWFQSRQPADGLIHQLVVSAPPTSRAIEPRLTGGFAWAALRRNSRGPAADDADYMRLTGAAGEVINRAGKDGTTPARHAEAAARLLMGDPKRAITILDAITPKDAGTWNDLAAAHYALADTDDAAGHLRLALGAVDASLQAAPRTPEALFNRALIVERLGLKQPARAAWQRYLEVEPSGGWSDEARNHLQRLNAAFPDFRDQLQSHYAAIARGDVQAARKLVELFPEQTRATAEVEVLGDWAAASIADPEQAERHLAVARVTGSQLRALNHEALLADAVDAIDSASIESRKALARAHIDYRQARQLYRDAGPAAADALMRHAARAFEASGSPMALVSRYYVGQILHDLRRIEEADAALADVERQAGRYQALQAQVAWERGLCHSAQGLWSLAVRDFETSTAIFAALGEQSHAAFVTELRAEVLERIGDTTGAWRARLTALPRIGDTNTRQLDSVLNAIAFAAARNSEWLVARSFLFLEDEASPQPRSTELHAYALLRRALVEQRLGHLASSERFRIEAAHVAAAVRDEGQRAQLHAQMVAVGAILKIPVAPHESVQELSTAIEYSRGKGDQTQLPDLLLERGRARLAIGDETSALEDFLEGIRQLERQRHELPSSLRWAIFDVRRELFSEAVALEVSTGHAERAFALADRSRARSILDRFTHSERFGQHEIEVAGLPDDVAVIEPVFAQGKLYEFVAQRGGVAVFQTSISEKDLGAAAQTASAAIFSGQLRSSEARALDRILVDPIADQINGAATLVFVPPPEAQGVPFATLIDSRTSRTLVEDHQVVVSPSATVFLAAWHRQRSVTISERRVFIVANPASTELAQLSAAEDEASMVASLYSHATVLTRGDATAATFAQGCSQSNLVHFAGHTLTQRGRIELALAGRGDTSLDAEQIGTLDLPMTNAVVLAGCDTAVLTDEPNEGPASIAHGFLAAGVPSVIATLHAIDDRDAAEFFVALHRHLAAHERPAEALRHTQIEWIQAHKPPVWAAVELFGC